MSKRARNSAVRSPSFRTRSSNWPIWPPIWRRRALLYLAAAKVGADAPDKTRFSAMAKKLATDNGSSIVDRALQMFGGYGYLKDYPIERFWRDLRVHRILEGTNEVMRMIVGRDLLK